MSTPLRVLIVEDEADDAESIVLRLEEEGFRLDWRRVQTESEYLAALETPPDLILADWTLPQFSGLRALQRMRERGLDIPFVIVSGTIVEEAAVDALRHGASDYVFKDRLTRLGQAVQRALDDLRLREDRQRAAAALRAERDRAQTYLDVASVILVALNLQGEITLINKMGCTVLGVEEHDLIGQNWFDNFVPEHARQMVKDYFYRLVAGESSGDTLDYYENVIVSKSGEERTVAWRNVVIRDESNRVVGTLSSGEDITARKQAEQELRKLSQAVESSPSIVYITDLDGKLEYVNPKFAEVTGYTVEEALGRLPRILDPDKIPHDAHEERWSVIRSGQEWRGEFQNRKKNGEPFWESASISSIKDETGTISHFVLVMEEITERKLAELQLRDWNETLEQRVIERTAELNHAKERIEAILNSSSDVLIMCRMDGTIDQVNPAFEATFRCRPDGVIAQPLTVLVVPDHITTMEQAFATAIETRQPRRLEITARCNNLAPFDADVVLSPIVENEDRLTGVVCSLRDITQRKRMEAQLRRTLEREMELGELKSRYVSMAAHDLRNPLAIIQSAAEMIQHYGDRLTNEQKQARLNHIHTNIEVMVETLDDILTIGKIESGRLSFSPTPVDMAAFCQTIAAEVQQAAGTQQPIDFSIDGLCGVAYVDAKLLRHVLGNLLSNALKYSSEKSTVVFVADCDPDQITFRIEDHGIGIPQADQQQLFEAFHRARNVRHIPGTGLGLAIVKQSVELHGGTIKFESEEGVGTTVTVVIPHAPPDELR